MTKVTGFNLNFKIIKLVFLHTRCISTYLCMCVYHSYKVFEACNLIWSIFLGRNCSENKECFISEPDIRDSHITLSVARDFL